MGKKEKKPLPLPKLAKKIAAEIKEKLPKKNGLRTRRKILAYIRKQTRQEGRFAINIDNLLVEKKTTQSKNLLKPFGEKAEGRYERTLKAQTRELEKLVWIIIESVLDDQEIEINSTIEKRYEGKDEQQLLGEVISQQSHIPPLIGYLILKRRLSLAIVGHLEKQDVTWDDKFSSYELAYAKGRLAELVRSSLKGHAGEIKTELNENAADALDKLISNADIKHIYGIAMDTSKTRRGVHSTAGSLIISRLQTDGEKCKLSPYVKKRLIKIARQKAKHEWREIGNGLIARCENEASKYVQECYIKRKEKATRLKRDSLMTSLKDGASIKRLVQQEMDNTFDATFNFFQRTYFKKILTQLFKDWKNQLKKEN